MIHPRALEPEHRVLTTRQGPVHYREYGPADGLPVLFVHGILVNGRLYEEVIPRLDPRLRCLVPDWPLGAHPAPMAEGADLSVQGVVGLIAEFLDRLQLERVVLVGSDSGGALVQLFAAAHPERVQAIVLGPSDAFEVWLPWIFKPLEWAAFMPGALWVISRLMRWPRFRRLPLAFGWLTARVDPARAEAFALPWSRSSGLRRDLGQFLRDLGPRHTLGAAPQLARVTAPVHLVWAAGDRLFPTELGRRLAAAFKNATFEEVADSRSLVPLDQPERFALAIEGHLLRHGLLRRRPSIANEVMTTS